MAKSTAGILIYRKSAGKIEILLGHMGGPFWSKRDENAWTIPKGEFEPDQESPIDAARREFKEETGMDIHEEMTALFPFLKNNKRHYFFIVEKNPDPDNLQSNTFQMEWPPKSGTIGIFPELDCFAWFDLKIATKKIVKGQLPALEQFLNMMGDV
jgi:predicted NUDIX family NTP pyrophosphohydrolase